MKLYSGAENNYEKLHIYRIIYDDKDDLIESDVIKKFINQTFHSENDYIYQLDPAEYQTVPQYVIDECDKCIAELTKWILFFTSIQSMLSRKRV